MVQFESQLSGILSDIDTTTPPFASPATAAQQSVCASPVTERALRYHRRDALRTDRSTVAPVPLPSPTDSPDPLDDFGRRNARTGPFKIYTRPSVRSPAPAPSEPMDYTRTLRCHRGPFWVVLADPPHPKWAGGPRGPPRRALGDTGASGRSPWVRSEPKPEIARSADEATGEGAP